VVLEVVVVEVEVEVVVDDELVEDDDVVVDVDVVVMVVIVYSSVTFERAPVLPPIHKPASCVPAPAKPYLATLRLPPYDQVVPLYSSVTFE